MPPSTLLSVTDVSKQFGSEEVFAGVSFQLAEREHAALVGANGSGKSTLLRIIAGLDYPGQGVVAPVAGARITYLPQEARFTSERTVRDEARLGFAAALEAGARMRQIEEQMTRSTDAEIEALLSEYGRLQARFDASGGYEIEHRTDEVLMGLGFDQQQFAEPVKRLSGGQKTRVALAKALLADPDLLLLDEPTNHLDLAMLEWIEGFLRSWSGACLIVSHDRYFLDRVTTRTLDLSFGTVEDYPAPYARYLKLREERLKRRQQEYDEQQQYIERTEEFIRKYKAGQRSREARGRQTRLDRLERVAPPLVQESLRLRVNPAVRSGQSVLTMAPMRVGYVTPNAEHQLVTSPELRIERGDRVGLIGPNGSGKTTLLRTITGEVPPLHGRFSFGSNVKLGYYAQGHEGLPFDGTPLSVVLQAQSIGEEGARTYLGRFLFSDDDVFKTVGTLSGGERSRLALAVLLLQQANFLILDEPTNHLDIPTRETLEEMLAAFEGTLLFISHDRYFIDKLADHVWAIEDGQITPFLGNYSAYQRKLGHRDGGTRATSPAEPSNNGQEAPREISQRPVPIDGKLQKTLGQVERDISKLEEKLNEISDAISVASIDQDAEAVARLGSEYERVQDDLEAAYARWEELTAQFELTASGSAQT